MLSCPTVPSLCPAGNAAPAPSFSLAYEQGGVGKLLKEAQGGRLVPGQAPPKTGAASKNARRNAARKKRKEGSTAGDDGEEDQAQPSTVTSEPAAVNGHSTDAVTSGGPGWQAETRWFCKEHSFSASTAVAYITCSHSCKTAGSSNQQLAWQHVLLTLLTTILFSLRILWLSAAIYSLCSQLADYPGPPASAGLAATSLEQPAGSAHQSQADNSEDATSKKVKALHKKLRQIQQIKEKGGELQPEQLKKIAQEEEVCAELRSFGEHI